MTAPTPVSKHKGNCTMERKIQPTTLENPHRESTRAGFPEPTISSKLAGVKSITLLAVATPLKTDNMQATRENVFIKERIFSQIVLIMLRILKRRTVAGVAPFD